MGFGTLFWLGLGRPEVAGGVAFGWYFVGYALAVGGLLFSVGHLANKVNAIKAFSQWRTSWLSREAVMAVVSLLVVALAALGRIFGSGAPMWLSVLGSILALITVFTTSMMYVQLKTVPSWRNPLNSVLFLTFALAGGAVITNQGAWAAVLLVVAGLVQFIVWRQSDGSMAATGSTTGTATGLGSSGSVRPFEPPHHGANYLLKEMAYQVGRKHRDNLRMIGLGVGIVLPVLMLSFASGTAIWLAALACHVVGMLAIRWVFFADARHVMSLYYRT